jgi:hypothetical protein
MKWGALLAATYLTRAFSIYFSWMKNEKVIGIGSQEAKAGSA